MNNFEIDDNRMITLNLLPPAEKNELRLEKNMKLFISYGSAILCLVLIFLVLLAGILFFLNIKIDDLNKTIDQQKKSVSSETIKKLKENIEAENKRLKLIDNIQSQQKRNSIALEKIVSLVPSGISLSSLALDSKNGKVALSGVAQSGDIFLAFQDAFKKDQKISQVEWPLSNLNSSEAGIINFQITFLVKE